MSNRVINLSVGFIMILGILSLVYVSVSFGNVSLLGENRYSVTAVFSDATGLSPNTDVEMLGINVGEVESIKLTDRYEAQVELSIDRDIDIPEDTIASVKTKGLLGERYVYLSPGALPPIPKDGSGRIRETQPPIILEDLLGKAVFGSTGSGGE
jgi:phospholipid/cholesterol/gamma-HCH transport system substrate-binding protein